MGPGPVVFLTVQEHPEHIAAAPDSGALALLKSRMHPDLLIRVDTALAVSHFSFRVSKFSGLGHRQE